MPAGVLPGVEGPGFLKAERWCRTRHLPEQKLRSLSRHTQKVRPQVQQAAVFLISLHHVTPALGLPEQALLTRCLGERGSWSPPKCPLFWRKLLATAAEAKVEGTGHDSRSARTAALPNFPASTPRFHPVRGH